jgi:hypothetical protein
VARTLAYRGKTDTFTSLPALFQGLCGVLRDAGTLPNVYRELALIKQRILSSGQPLVIGDVAAVVEAHQARAGVSDMLVLSAPRVVLRVPGTGERMAYHREFLHNLKLTERPLLTLNEETLVEILAVVVHPRHFTAQEQRELLSMGFAQQEGLGVLRILDTIYKATFSRTIRKELCDHKVLFPLKEGSYHLLVDSQRTAHLTLPAFELFRQMLFRLYRTPDLASVLDTDDRGRSRIQDGLRLLSGSLHDAAILPQKRQEVEAILGNRKPADDEDLEEL